MRLTLRTLLAYLDDILEPAQARVIGAKIAESSMAQDLVARLKEVTRRRRLLAPDVDGPGMGVDPNVVAEYLNNDLPADDVADVERVCLESDIHLAEVAAVHQILTLVQGESLPIASRTLERMYALGPIGRRPANGFVSTEKSGSAKDATARTEPARVAAAAVVPSTNGSAAPVATEPEASRIPEYLRSKSVWQQAWPWVVVLGLAALFIGLLWTDPTFRSKLQPGTTPSDESVASAEVSEASKPKDVVAGAIPPAAAASGAVGESGSAAVSAAAPGKPAVPNPPNPATVAIDPPPPKEPGDAKLPVPNDPSATTPKPGTEVAAATPAVPVKPGKTFDPKANPVEPPPGEKPPESKPPAVNPPAAGAGVAKAGPQIEYTSSDGVLLRFDLMKNDWASLPRHALLQAGDRLASPEPFDATLAVEKGLLNVTVVNGTVVTLLEPSATAPVGFAVRHGRLLLQTKSLPNEPAKAGGEEKIVPVALAAGQDVWQLKLSEDTICAVEIVAHEPTALEQNLGATGWNGRVAVISGTVSVLDAQGGKRTLPTRSSLELLPTTVQPVETKVFEGAEMPKWVELGAAKQIDRRVLNLFEKEFDPSLTVSTFLPALVDNPLPLLSELATKALGITDNYAALVKALASAPHKETRLAAINALRLWLGETPKNGGLLIPELERNFPSGDDGIVYLLLWGFSDDDARDPTKCSLLVDWLDHPQLGVRELAYFHLKNITKLSHRYDAQASPALRKPAAARFRTHLMKEGGTFLKAVKPAF